MRTNGDTIKKRIRASADSDSGDALATSMIVLIVLALVSLVVFTLMFIFIGATVEEKDPSYDGLFQQNSEPESDSEPAPPAEPIDWTPLIVGGGALLGFGALRGGCNVISSSRKSREEKNDHKEAVKSRWEAAESRHSKILIEYSEYETDIWKALLYPAMHDPNVEETSKFLKVLQKADSMKRENSDLVDKKTSSNDYILKEYEDTVGDLNLAFNAARDVAEKIQYSTLGKDERKDIHSAVNLLNHAEDSANSTEARQSYYEQLLKVVNRLNEKSRNSVIPTHTLNLIEDQSRLMITDGSSKVEAYSVMNIGSDNKSNASA